MRLHSKLWIWAAILAVFLLSGCGLTLADDVTPPPNYREPTDAPVEPTRAQTAALQTVFPLVPPDPAQGKTIYAAKCLPCHGETGMGDGPQAANLPNPAAPIGSAELARKSRPVDWYSLVTNGNLEKFMPGFTESLDERQRWDVVSYAMTLSTTNEDLEKGKAVYLENCAGCHGENGRGDGAQAASLDKKPAAWAKDQAVLARLSADDIVKVITGGLEGHPSLGDKLDDTQRYQLAAFVRSLSFANAGLPVEVVSSGNNPGATGTTAESPTQQAVGEANSPADQKVTVSGKVTNGTQGSKATDKLKVELRVFNGMSPAFEQTAFTDPDGTYRFEDVPLDQNYVYYTLVDSDGLVFNSDILHGKDISGKAADLPVQIYDTATDASVLRADRMHVFFDFSKPGVMQVVNLFVISNPSDRVVIAEPKEKPVLQFEIPKEATNLQFQDGTLGDGRYIQTENGFGDTQAIAPGTGQYQLLYAYDMPYTNKTDIDFKAPLPVEAAIVMVPPSGVKLKSDQLTDAGERDVQGMSFHMYQSVNSMNPGDRLAVSLSGNVGAPGAETSNQQMTPLLIGVGVFGLALAGAGVWLYRRRETAQEEPVEAGSGETLTAVSADPGESSDAILDAILALDDLHANGKLPEAAYQQRRGELKARLAAAIEKEKGH